MNRPGVSGDSLCETSAGWREAVLSVVGGLEFDGWDVAAVLVESAVVEPVDVLGGSIGYVTPVEFEQHHYRQINARPQPRSGEPARH